MPETRSIAFDIKLMRPACVLVAAAYRADSSVPNRFDTEDWLLAPTPDMKVYHVTPKQLDQLVEMVRAHRRSSRPADRRAPYSDHRDPTKWPDPAPGG